MAGKSRSKKNLENAVSQALSVKQDKPNLVPALVGAYVNGQKTVAVAGRNDFIWCRMRGDTSEVIQAFNDAVGEHFDLPILVFRDPDFPTIWKVYGRDIRAYEDWGNVSYLPPHGDAHSFSGLEDSGIDTVWVAKRQYMPLLPRPVVTGTTAIYLEPDFYYFDGQYHWWPGSGTTSLLNYLPTGGTTARFVTVYINSAGNPDYISGDEFVMIPSPPDVGSLISLPTPAQGVPICAVRLYTGTTTISWGDIFDLRNPNQPLQNTGSSIEFFDESVYQGAGWGLNVAGENVELTISGTYAHLKSTASGSVTIYDEGVLLGQAYGLNFYGDNVVATMTGTIAHVFVTGAAGGAASATGTIVIYDENVFRGLFEEVRFIGDEVAVYNSGSYAAIAITGSGPSIYDGVRSTYALVGEPLPLDTITGEYWKVPTEIYASGSLNVFIDGLSQYAGNSFEEQFPVSGTYRYLFPLTTGVTHEAKWGHPVDQVQNSTGTFVVFDEGVLQGAVQGINFEGTPVSAAVTGSYAHVFVTGTGIEVFDESISLGVALAMNFIGSGVEAVMSGTVAHIMHTGTAGGSSLAIAYLENNTDYDTINNGAPAVENNWALDIDAVEDDVILVIQTFLGRNETTDWGLRTYLEEVTGDGTVTQRTDSYNYYDPNNWITTMIYWLGTCNTDGTLQFKNYWAALTGGRAHFTHRKGFAINFGQIDLSAG